MKFTKLFMAVLVVAAVTLGAVPAMAGEGCLLPGKLKKLPVPVIRAELSDDGYSWVLFQDVPLDGLPGTPRADIKVYVGWGVGIKVKRDLGGNALDVSHFDCYVVNDTRVRIYAYGSDTTFFVTSDVEKERWKTWFSDYRKAQRQRYEEAKKVRYQRLAPPPLND